MNFEFNCLGILRKNSNSKYEFVVRWFIYDKDDNSVTYMPHPDSTFKLYLRTKLSNEYIDVNGDISITTGAQKHLPIISPMNYLMAAPPKDSNIPPEGPIKLKDEDGESGIGVFHILTDTRRSRYSKKIMETTAETIRNNDKINTNKIYNYNSIDEYSRNFTHHILNNNISPRNLQAIYINEVKKLEELSFFKSSSVADENVPELFRLNGDDIEAVNKDDKSKSFENQLDDAWENAIVLKELFKDAEYLTKINDYVVSAENMKSQLSILGIQGMEIIDYWCSPYKSMEDREENDCGRKYQANEAVGLGTTIGNIDKEVIERWVESGDDVLISLEYIPPLLSKLNNDESYNWKDLHDDKYLDDIPPKKSTTGIITNTGTNSLANTLENISSCFPDQPKSGNIDFDLYNNKLKSDIHIDANNKNGDEFVENIDMATGDGRAKFKMIIPDDKVFPFKVSRNGEILDHNESSLITGINLYGMWEPEDSSSGLMTYFNNPETNPEKDELKEWLITRRYSYNKEIAPFFLPSNVNLSTLQYDPPKSPAIKKLIQVTNLEKILNIDKNSDIVNETMPLKDIDENMNDVVTFSINIREGFKNQHDGTNGLTWDKLPISSMESNWQPELWRSGNKKDTPQRYRFWATCTDIFGQESELISIFSKETSQSLPSALFQFKNRFPIQPPPSNNDKSKQLLNIELKKDEIKLSWESPFRSSIGNSVDDKLNPLSQERIPKTGIVGNIIYLRKPHTNTSQVSGEDNIELLINNLLSGLSDTYKNDRWFVGLKEIMVHNPGWEAYKTIEGLANNDSGNSWNHSISLVDADRGFDYMALINFSIKQEYQKFWVKNDNERVLHIAKQTRKELFSEYDYLLNEKIPEFPCISNVVATEPVAFINKFPPKLVNVVNEEFQPAKPILGINGLNRDLILSNILSIPNEIINVELIDENNIENISAVVFESSENQILLTKGQEVLIDSAIHRSGMEKKVNSGKFYNLLASEISNINKNIFPVTKSSNGDEYFVYDGESSNNMIYSDLIGFRGVKHIKIAYTGISTNNQKDKEKSEAIKYNVYQTRFRLNNDISASKSFSPVSFKKKDASTYTNVRFSKDVEPEKIGIPLFIIEKFDSEFTIMQIDTITLQSNHIYEIKTGSPIIGNLSGKTPEKIMFVVASQLFDKEIELNESNYFEDSIFLPVGGGYQELFIWSIGTSSALGKNSVKYKTIVQEYQSSVLPPAPEDVVVSTINTPDEKIKYSLDAKNHRNWLPLKLRNDSSSDLKRKPRNYIKWQKNNQISSDVYISIERLFIENYVDNKELKSTPVNNWELASDVEKLAVRKKEPNTKVLLPDSWLAKDSKPSLYGWLFNMANINKPGESEQNNELMLTGPGSKLFDMKQQLEMTRGLIADPLNPTSNVAFVDYFHDSFDLEFPMDTFRSYNYRLKSYIDIDPHGTFGIKDPTQKYLASNSGQWSGYIRPTFPEVEINISKGSVDIQPESISPSVEFQFTFNDKSFSPESFLSTPKPLYYRIIVRREIKNSGLSKKNSSISSSYIEIGKPRDIPVLKIQGESYIINDNNIDRENYNEEVKLVYMVDVSVISIDTDKGTFSIIRKSKVTDPKTIKVPVLVDGQEVKQNVTVKIS
jgi:hypothetical protein